MISNSTHDTEQLSHETYVAYKYGPFLVSLEFYFSVASYVTFRKTWNSSTPDIEHIV